MTVTLGDKIIAAGGSSVFRGTSLGQIITSRLPISDAGVCPLDGSVLDNGSYSAFVSHIAGLSVSNPELFCTETQWQTSVSTFGSCDKFVYNSTNQTVRIPLRNSEHGDLIYSYKDGANWYRIYSDGWCEQGGQISYAALGSGFKTIYYIKPFLEEPDVVITQKGSYYNSTYLGQHIDNAQTSTATYFSSYVDNNIPFKNWVAYGYIDVSAYQYSPKYEYLVIATAVKLPEYVDIDEIMTDLNGKVSKADLIEVRTVIESYVNGTSWYRAWSDGWCEQGGTVSCSMASSGQVFGLLKTFIDTNYTILATLNAWAGLWSGEAMCRIMKTSTAQFTIQCGGNGVNPAPVSWYACGYIS